MNSPEPQDGVDEREWETLPPPSPVPLKKVQPYDSPRRYSPDPVVLRLTSAPHVWVLTALLTLWTVFMVVLVASASYRFLWIPLPFACGVGYGWYRLLLPRRLALDSEGFELSGVGNDPVVFALQWDDLTSLHLELRSFARGTEVLHLIAEPAPGTPAWSELDNVIDLPLGTASYGKVDAALRAYAKMKYRPRTH